MNSLIHKDTNNNISQLSNDFPLFDSSLLSKISEAERGCIYAMQDLYFAFRDGKGAKQDYQSAKHFLEMSMQVCETKPDMELMKADIMTHQVYLEMKLGNVDGMKKCFKALLNYQIENLVMEEWNWDAIKIVSELYEKHT